MSRRRTKARRAGRAPAAAPASRASRGPDSLRAREVALLAALYALLALAVYGPSLRGPFLSDDYLYVVTNPYVHDLSAANIVAMLDPRSPATQHVAIYAPVQQLVHGLEWKVFGPSPTGYHVVNVLLHALGSALLAAVFVSAGLPRLAGIGAATVFLLHPANVEAVAWVSQAKTTTSFVLSAAALLAYRRRPALGTLLFALALLAKATAAFALPVAALLDWTRDRRIRWGWLAAWAVILCSHTIVDFRVHQRLGWEERQIDPDWGVRLRTSAAFVARYAWMAATSIGVAAFQEPAAVRSWLDPWALAGAALVVAVAARSIAALRRRSPEAAFWAWAVVSYVPVSLIFAFLHPFADRYLYFILPGLLGGVLFAARDVAARPGLRDAMPAWLPRAAAAGAVALGIAFAAVTVHRAALWGDLERLFEDSALHYPDGRIGQLYVARRAVQAGDPTTAIAALRRAFGLGFNRFEQLQADPVLAPLNRDPRYGALLSEMAESWVQRIEAMPAPTQLELRVLAQAHYLRGERTAAIAALERALAVGGPIDDVIRDDLARLRGTPR